MHGWGQQHVWMWLLMKAPMQPVACQDVSCSLPYTTMEPIMMLKSHTNTICTH